MPSPIRVEHMEADLVVLTWLGVYVAATPGVHGGGDGSVRLDADNEVQPDALLRIDAACGGQSLVAADGFIAGAPLGGAVYHYFGTAWVGYVAACLCLVNLLGIWLLLPESLHQRDPHAPIRFAPITATVRALRDIRFRDIYLIGFIYIAAFSMMQTAVPLLW